MNLYCSLNQIKSVLGISGTGDDSVLLEIIEAASRKADTDCKRHFYAVDGTRYFDAAMSHYLVIDDCLSVSALTTDSEGDGTFDGEEWTATDYYLWPLNVYPKRQVRIASGGDFNFADKRNYAKITGAWGYGNGVSASPWTATAIAGTVATTGGTSLTLSAAGTISAGHTIKMGSEQMYVSAVSSTTATVTRAVNGTTASTHSAAQISTASYPADIVRAVLWYSVGQFNERRDPNLQMQMIGEYQEQRSSAGNMDVKWMHGIGAYVRSFGV